MSWVPVRMAGVTCDDYIFSFKFINLVIQVILRVISLLNVEKHCVSVCHIRDWKASFGLILVPLILWTLLTWVSGFVVKRQQRIRTYHRNALPWCHVKRLRCAICTCFSVKIRLGQWAKFWILVKFEIVVNGFVLLLNCCWHFDDSLNWLWI